MSGKVLLVDDERHILLALRRVLEEECDCLIAGSAAEALETFARQGDEIEVVVADNVMPEMRGVELLAEVRKRWPRTVRILLTGYSSNEAVMDAINQGHVFSYIRKPVEADDFLIYVRNALSFHRALVEQDRLSRALELSRAEQQVQSVQLKRQTTPLRAAFPEIVGSSSAMESVLEIVEEVAATRAPVLVEGETGTGKEVLARAIHRLSGRQPFVSLNCAAIPETILESELFGHERGAFTGAVRTQIGKFEAAHGGTIFLDEIGEMPLNLQAKLLRVLQEGEVVRLGNIHGRKVDVRIVAATNRDLRRMTDEGTFRLDLYFRLNVIRIRIPTLRERRADVAPLIQHFLEKFSRDHGKSVTGIAPDALELLLAHPYPGNVRELSNWIERGVLLSRGPVLTVDALPSEVRDAAPAPPASVSPASSVGSATGLTVGGPSRQEVVDHAEKTYLEDVLRQTGGSVVEALRRTQIPRATFYRKLDRLGIDPAAFRRGSASSAGPTGTAGGAP
ncbi:MAG: sigma-54 dependent transcriptional regulator [bacterium]